MQDNADDKVKTHQEFAEQLRSVVREYEPYLDGNTSRKGVLEDPDVRVKPSELVRSHQAVKEPITKAIDALEAIPKDTEINSAIAAKVQGYIRLAIFNVDRFSGGDSKKAKELAGNLKKELKKVNDEFGHAYDPLNQISTPNAPIEEQDNSRTVTDEAVVSVHPWIDTLQKIKKDHSTFFESTDSSSVKTITKKLDEAIEKFSSVVNENKEPTTQSVIEFHNEINATLSLARNLERSKDKQLAGRAGKVSDDINVLSKEIAKERFSPIQENIDSIKSVMETSDFLNGNKENKIVPHKNIKNLIKGIIGRLENIIERNGVANINAVDSVQENIAKVLGMVNEAKPELADPIKFIEGDLRKIDEQLNNQFKRDDKKTLNQRKRLEDSSLSDILGVVQKKHEAFLRGDTQLQLLPHPGINDLINETLAKAHDVNENEPNDNKITEFYKATAAIRTRAKQVTDNQGPINQAAAAALIFDISELEEVAIKKFGRFAPQPANREKISSPETAKQEYALKTLAAIKEKYKVFIDNHFDLDQTNFTLEQHLSGAEFHAQKMVDEKGLISREDALEFKKSLQNAINNLSGVKDSFEERNAMKKELQELQKSVDLDKRRSMSMYIDPKEFPKYGVPLDISGDQDTSFGKHIAAMLKDSGIKLS